MGTGMKTALAMCIELVLLYFRSYAESVVNRFCAAEQMAAETGYQYDLMMGAIRSAWFALSVTVAVVYAVDIYIHYLRRKKNEESY